MYIQKIQKCNIKINELNKSSINFCANKVVTKVTEDIADKSLKILGAATAAITAASIAMNKKAQKNETLSSLEIPKAYDPIVQENIDSLIKEYGKDTIALILKIKNIDLTSKNCDQYSTMKIHDLLKLINVCELELSEENIFFIDTANSLMQKNLCWNDSRAFIPETLKQIKPEEREAFIDWLKYCNEKAESIKDPEWLNSYKENDRKSLVENITYFVKNESFRQNPKEYLELIKASFADNKNIQDRIEFIFDKANIRPEQVSTCLKINNEIKNIKDFNGESNLTLKSVYILLEDEKSFLQWIKKAKPIYEKFNFHFGKAKAFFEKYQNGEISDERIEKVLEDIKDISENNPDYKRRIVHEMLTCDLEKYDLYKDWLQKIDKNIVTDLSFLEYTPKILNYILFDEKSTFLSEKTLKENKELYEKLLENTEILEAIKNGEIIIDDKFITLRDDILPKEDYKKFFGTKKQQDPEQDSFSELFLLSEDERKDIISEIYSTIPPDMVIENLFSTEQGHKTLDVLGKSNKAEIFKFFETINKMKIKTFKNPELFLNGEISDPNLTIFTVENIYRYYMFSLFNLTKIFDKETIDILMGKRLQNFAQYLETLKNLDKEHLSLLKDMVNSNNTDGKPLMPTQKIEMIDLLYAYQLNNLDTTPIKEMLEAGRIDLGKLQKNLFNKLMKNAGLSDDEIATIPMEKLASWDVKYIHLLSKEMQEKKDTVFNDILRAGCLEPDFIKYIHNSENIYGQANAKTKAMFAEKGLNYEKWIHPSKDSEMRFAVKDKNTEKLSQIANQIVEDIESLRSGPVKGFIDKQFPRCIKDGKFIIPTEVIGSKVNLKDFVENIIKQLDSVWKRAQGNVTNPDLKRSQTAKGTLTILDHLNQRLEDISAINDDDKNAKSLDWTIKMWNRIPQKDIFQGNYSTCCIAMGGVNGSAMPHYIMNTAYNMIELVDNNTGTTVGNALCYFAENEKREPIFIIDNVEIANSIKPSDEIGAKLRIMIKDYASKIAEEVTGAKNVPIYLGPNYNDIPYRDLPNHKEKIKFLGDIDCDEIYMDAYTNSADWTNKANFTKNVQLLNL